MYILPSTLTLTSTSTSTSTSTLNLNLNLKPQILNLKPLQPPPKRILLYTTIEWQKKILKHGNGITAAIASKDELGDYVVIKVYVHI